MTKMLKFSEELSFPLEAVTQKFDFMGQSGGGKTYDAMKLAELMLEADAQILVFDIPGVWPGLRSSADGKSPGFKVLLIGGEDGDLPINASSGRLLADMVVDTGLSVILNLSEMLGDEMLIFLTDFVTRFFDRKKRSRDPVHVFIEECQEIIPETIDNRLQVKLRAVCIRMMKIGRNYGIGWSAITQEPQAASKRAINQAGTIVAVRTVGEHERKALERWARSKAKSKEQLALMDILPELETGQALVWSPGWLKHAGVVNVLPKITFDSSKTPEVGKKRPTANVVADIDLEKLKSDMAELVQKAEAEDPTLLQKKLSAAMADNVRLRAELVKRGAAPAASAKVQTKIKQERVVLTKDARIVHAAIARLESVNTKWTMSAQQMRTLCEALAPAQAQIDESVKRMQKLLGDVPLVDATSTRVEMPRPPPDLKVVFDRRPMARAVERYASPAKSGGDQRLAKGERVVLSAIAQHSAGVSREQLSVLTGYKRSSRDTYLQKLGAAGHTEEDRDSIRVTESGLAALGPSYQPLPVGDELRRHWLGELPEGERRVLEVVLDHYPRAVPREVIDEATGYKRSSRDTYLQKLSARKLVLSDRDGVKASSLLFSAA